MNRFQILDSIYTIAIILQVVVLMNEQIIIDSNVNQSSNLTGNLQVELYCIKMMLGQKQKNFRIVKTVQQGLLCSITHHQLKTQTDNRFNNSSHKFLYHEFCGILPLTVETRLIKLEQMNHPSLLKVYRYDRYTGQQCQQGYGYGIVDDCSLKTVPKHRTNQGFHISAVYLENYSTHLSKQLNTNYSQNTQELYLTCNSSVFTQQLDEKDIINTFEPIVEAIDYLQHQGLNAYCFEDSNILESVVITEQGQVKYMDQAILNILRTNQKIEEQTNSLIINGVPLQQCNNVEDCEKIKDSKTYNPYRIYEKLSEIIYNIFIPQKTTRKSWKSRLRILKQKVSKQSYNFFMKIYNKSLCHSYDQLKTKKIIKQYLPLKPQQSITQKAKKIIKNSSEENFSHEEQEYSKNLTRNNEGVIYHKYGKENVKDNKFTND